MGWLIVVVGALLGFGVWLYGPPPGYRWKFEDEGPWEPYYVDLPLLVGGLPLLALLVWLAARAVFGRDRRWLPTVAAGLALGVLTWGGSLWIAGQESESPYGPPGSGRIAERPGFR